MNKYEQRRLKRLQNPEFAAGYRAMEAELQLVHAIEAVTEHQHVSREDLAEDIGSMQEFVAQIFSFEERSSAIGNLIELFSALNITADITLRQAKEGESPIHVATELLS